MNVTVTVHRYSNDPAQSDGYDLQVRNDDGKVVDEYSAGGNPHDSQAPGLSSIVTCQQWARISAIQAFKTQFGRLPHDDEIAIETGE